MSIAGMTMMAVNINCITLMKLMNILYSTPPFPWDVVLQFSSDLDYPQDNIEEKVNCIQELHK